MPIPELRVSEIYPSSINHRWLSILSSLGVGVGTRSQPTQPTLLTAASRTRNEFTQNELSRNEYELTRTEDPA